MTHDDTRQDVVEEWVSSFRACLPRRHSAPSRSRINIRSERFRGPASGPVSAKAQEWNEKLCEPADSSAVVPVVSTLPS